jgi:hypothetical protein
MRANTFKSLSLQSIIFIVLEYATETLNLRIFSLITMEHLKWLILASATCMNKEIYSKLLAEALAMLLLK